MMRRSLYILAAFVLPHGDSGYLLPPTTSTGTRFPTTVLDASKQHWTDCITSDPRRSASFTGIMTLCGAALGPFLDSYHSAFGVLRYEEPIQATLWGTAAQPALTTAWWVPELFGLAGFIIGWLYILLDSSGERPNPSPPLILIGISIFTFQYWLSGVLFFAGTDRSTILAIMSVVASGGFFALDGTMTGFWTSLATAVGGPLIEVGLLSLLHGHGGYQYLDSGETGFFPLWIVPVYFLGGPAVGNLARGFWNLLSRDEQKKATSCEACNNSRAVPCPNCDGQGYYVTYGRQVECPACKGRGLVICRACFDNYNEDPNDIKAIQDIMARMPD